MGKENMALTPEDFERAEQLAQYNREVLSRGGTPVPISIGVEPAPRQKPIRPVFERQIAGRIEHLVVVPVELIHPRGLDISLGTFAKKVRFELNQITGTQRREFPFIPFVLCQETGLFLPGSDKGSQRFSRSLAWQPFNPWSVFSGNPRDRKLLKALGVSFG